MPHRIKPRYLSARQTVVYLGMVDDQNEDRERAIRQAVQALYQRVHRKQIKHTRIGRSLRFDTKDLDEMMESQRQEEIDTKPQPHWSRHLRKIKDGGGTAMALRLVVDLAAVWMMYA